MKILVTHQFTPNFGGSYLYTREITDVLKSSHKLVIINGHEISHNFDFDINSIEDIRTINFELIIIMQSQHFKNLEIKIRDAKLINIIHSEVYDVDNPLINNKAKYIAVRDEIKNHLIKNFNIKPEKITTLINPINKNYYLKNISLSDQKIDDLFSQKYGLFACGNFGQIRWKAALDFAIFCNELNLKSVLMAPLYGDLKKEFEKFYDKIVDPSENINFYMQNAQISGGILKGRTYWEAKLCGKPVIEYMVNPHGEINYEIYEKEPDENEINYIKKITNPQYIADEIIKISQIDSNNLLDQYFDMIYNIDNYLEFLNTYQINSIKIENYWYEKTLNQKELEILITFNQILSHAQENKYEKILIIQNNIEIKKEINQIFKQKFDLFKNDWQILIFSHDFSCLAIKEEAYIILKNNLNFALNLNQSITQIIPIFKTYVFKDQLIKFKQ